MELSINQSKSRLTEKVVQPAVPAEDLVVSEQFSLILDQAVSKTQEKTVAADKPQERSEQTAAKQAQAAVQKKASELFTANRPVVDYSQTKPVSDRSKTNTEDTEIKDQDENNVEITSAPAGIIQTQIQQTIEKNNFRGMAVEDIARPETKPHPKVQVPAGLNFEEILAAARQALARKDGEIVKLKFALEPEDLGKLDLYIFADKKNLHIAFASGAEARKILQSAQPELKNILTELGYSLTDLDFSGFSDPKHQELETKFLAQNNEKSDYGVLKNINKKDIIREVSYLLRDMLVDYLA